RLRQEHDALADGGPRPPHVGSRVRRRAGARRAARPRPLRLSPAEGEHDLPDLQPHPVDDGGGQRRLAADAGRRRAGGPQDAGTPTVRSQEPVDPPARMHWRDTLKVGLGSAGRRPLRTALTTTGVAIGIAALSLIVALAGGLQQALDAPALATSQVHQVAVFPVADARTPAFDAATLDTLRRLPHVRAAWGQIGMTGTF